MPEAIVDPSLPPCYRLFSGTGNEEFQQLGPDLLSPRARDAHGRFAKGSSGSPRGRQRGIPNPKSRVPDLALRPLSAQALLGLIGRKPHLLRPLAAQILPPPLGPGDPAERFGIDLSSLRTAKDCRQMLAAVVAAIARREMARPARRPHRWWVDGWLRALRRRDTISPLVRV